MRDAEDRLPKLRLLRVLVFLRFVDRAVFQRAARFLHAIEHAALRLVVAGSYLFRLFRIRSISHGSYPYKSAIVIEFAFLTFRPFVERADVHNDLSFRVESNLGAIHRPRRRSLEVDSLAIVATAMARTFKLVLTRLPVRRAAEMRAARVDDE